MTITKRDGTKVPFDSTKIYNCIIKAMADCGTISNSDRCLAQSISESIKVEDGASVEDIQDIVEYKLMGSRRKDVAKAYIKYRRDRTLNRESETLIKSAKLFDHSDEYLMKENANKKAELTNVQISYLAGITGTHFNRTLVFTSDVLHAHDSGAIHIHDMDMSAAPGITNCSLLNLYDPLVNGTVLNGFFIKPQTRFITACTVATQIIQGVAGLQYGGITVTMTHLVPALKANAKSLLDKLRATTGLYEDAVQRLFKAELADVVKQGVQTFMYQVNSMFTTQGQTPFLTVNLQMSEAKTVEDKKYLAMIIEQVLLQRIQGFQDEYGNWVAPAFPKLIFVLDESTMYGEYKYLRELAAKCNVNRLAPDYISAKVMQSIHGHVYPSMGCRSFLSEWTSFSNPSAITDPNKFYGRCNCGVVSLNLPYIAAEAIKDNTPFYDVLDKYAQLAHKAHQIRLKRIKETSVDCAPLLWRHGVFARCTDPDAKIGDIIKDEYASISLGYAGLYEAVRILGYSNHWEGLGSDMAMQIMIALNDYCKAWTLEDGVRYGVYGTPIEQTTLKFANAVKSIYPAYDRLYVTNSYHIPVFEEMSPFTKLEIEGRFQPLSKNGCISYVECADLSKNIEAVLEIQECIYEHCMYAELNIKSCKCYTCGSEEPQEIDENLVWYCPKCGERRKNKLRHLYRICGYASTEDANDGRSSDVKDRFIHADTHLLKE